ncbi:polysaccharide deacetylase family protein [Arthrobacter sp. JZ12]|nr:polysaccharide deacetylase family protein [Arthrobacter sp. JZ12]
MAARASCREEIVARFTGIVPQQWGLDVPGVLSSLPVDAGGAVLTLDYCGGPGGSQTDHAIFDLLRERRMPATLFMNYRWIESNSALAKELAEDPLFEIANHGTQHLPLSVNGQSAYGIPGTTGPGEVYDEIMTNTAVITELAGRPPRFFRPGTAHLDEVAAQICLALGQVPTGFSINGDAGATHPAHLVTQELVRAQSGDVIIAHGNQPASGTGAGVAAALAQREILGAQFVPLPPRLPEPSWP